MACEPDQHRGGPMDTLRLPRPWIGILIALAASAPSRGIAATSAGLERRRHAASGRAGAKCLSAYVDEVRRCRDAADTSCEEAIRTPDGALAQIVAGVDTPIHEACTEESVSRIGLTLGVDRYV